MAPSFGLSPGLLWVFTFICIIGFVNGNTILDSAVSKDYCIDELFQPRCWKSEVIVMETAFYGRRKVGKCVGEMEDATGCFVDVLPQLDKKCSGKAQCDVRVVDPDLSKISVCNKWVIKYLEASYICAAVVEVDRSCSVAVSSTPLHIASLSKNVCGTKFHPWILEAPAGQRINVSLLDFNALHGKVSEELDFAVKIPKPCQQYGYIVDKPARKNITICGGELARERLIYVSTSNVLELVFSSLDQPSGEFGSNFLIRLEAIGCSDLIPPEDTWLKRNNDEIVIGCYSSRQTWHLQCQGQRWMGVVSNCTQSGYAFLTFEQIGGSDEDYQVLGLVLVCVVGISICLMIICVGTICIRRYQMLSLTMSKVKSQLKYNYIESEERKSSLTPLSSNGHNHPKPTSQTQDEFHLPPRQYGGSDADRRNGNDDNQTLMTANSQYFVLDQEITVKENSFIGL